MRRIVAKGQPGKDIVILGLGRGRRLFADDGQYGTLHLVKSVATTTGVVVATCQPS